MGTERRSQAQRRESTRRQLLDAAGAVFARRGYRDATVADIVAAAGVSSGALYNHFASKRAIFLAVFDERFRTWSAGYRAALEPRGGPDDAVHSVARHYASLLRKRPDDIRLLIEFWSAAMRDDSLRPDFIDRHGQVRALVAALVDDVQERADVRSTVSATDLGAIVTALGDGLALQHLVDPQPGAHAEHLMSVALALLLRGARDTGP